MTHTTVKKKYIFGVILLGLIILLIQVSTAWAQPGTGIIRVNSVSGIDSLTCGSATVPCKTIQHAFDIANSGETIRLAAGTYTSSNSAVLVIESDTNSSKSIVIEGGYSPSNWNNYDPTNNVTIIDGQNIRRGLYFNAQNKGGRVTLKGVTFQNGLVTGSAKPGPYGGGLYCVNSGTVSLIDVLFSNNTAQGNAGSITEVTGGGAAFYRCAVTLRNVTFDGNQTIGSDASPRGAFTLGGGLFVTDNSTVDASQLIVTNNTAQAGDGTGGNGISGGERADANGGGIAIGFDSNANFNNLKIIGNQSIAGNSAVYGGFATSGGLHVEDGTAIITNAMIKENTTTAGAGSSGSAAIGAGIMVNHSKVTLNRVSVINNRAFGVGSNSNATGGGLYVSSYSNYTSLEGNNLVVVNNVVTGSGGGYSRGGGLGIDATGFAATITLNHATFSGNQLGAEDQGIAINSFGNSKATIDINHSIIANHINSRPTSGAVFVGPKTTINLKHTLWHSNTNNWATGGIVNDNNPHVGAPLFVSPNLPNYDYHIQIGSAAIDQASGSTTGVDIDGESRPFGSVSDLGADESRPPLENSSIGISPRIVRAENGPNHLVTYTIFVKNTSSQAISANLTDTLPSPGSPISVGLTSGPTCGTGTCSVASNNIIWSGTVPANDNTTISYTLQFNIPVSYTSTVVVSNHVSLSYNGYPDVNFSEALIVNGKTVYLPVINK